MKWMPYALAVVTVAGIALPAAAQQQQRQQRQNMRSTAPYPTGAVTPDGRIWERIQLQYVDVRAVAAALQGSPIVPSDYDLWRQSMGMMGGFGGYGGGYGGYGGGMGGGSLGGGFNGGMYGIQGQGGFGLNGSRFIANPNNNTLITGRGRRGASQIGQRGGLFPNVPIIVDPNTNALIVDP